MIGEIRDQATMQHAMAYAETGHLCVATLHSNNANEALERIINFFPETGTQANPDGSLTAPECNHFPAALHQVSTRKRVAVMEMMFNTGHVSELIGSGKLDEIKEAMTRSKAMVHKTFDQALFELYEQGKDLGRRSLAASRQQKQSLPSDSVKPPCFR